jgi:Holliday junction resolvase-like predicted endonuclease
VRHWAAAEAKAYLQTQGYTILAENYTVRGAEVDLIAQDGDTLVYIAETSARDDLPLRFDALLIEGGASSFSVTHLRGAF